MPKPITIKNLDRLGNSIYLHPCQGLVIEPDDPNILKKFNCFSDMLLDDAKKDIINKVYNIRQIYDLEKWCNENGDVFLGEINTWTTGKGTSDVTSIIARNPSECKPDNIFVIMPMMAEVVMEAHQRLVVIIYNDIETINFTPKVYVNNDYKSLNIELVNSYELEYYRDKYLWIKKYGNSPYKLNTPPIIGSKKLEEFSLFGYCGQKDSVKVHIYEFLLLENDLKKASNLKSGLYESSVVKIEYIDSDGVDEKSWYEFNLRVFVSKNKNYIKNLLKTRSSSWITKEIVKSRKTETSSNNREIIFPDLLNNAIFFSGSIWTWVVLIPSTEDSKFIICSGSKLEGCEISGEEIEPITIYDEVFARILIKIDISSETYHKLQSKKNLAISMIGSASITESMGDLAELTYRFNVYYEGPMAKDNETVINSLRNKPLVYNYPPALPVKKKKKKLRFKEVPNSNSLFYFFGYNKVTSLFKSPESSNFSQRNKFMGTKLFMEKLYGTDDTDYSLDPWRFLRLSSWKFTGD